MFKARPASRRSVVTMTETDITKDSSPDELPLFPAPTPDALADQDNAIALIGSVLDRLAEVIDITGSSPTDPTPCAGFDLAALQGHALAWLQFFAAALSDPNPEPNSNSNSKSNYAGGRIDPETWSLGEADPVAIVDQAKSDIQAAIVAGVLDQVVVMVQARMYGGAVVAMALGEYQVHAWDLAVSTGRSYRSPEGAAGPALEFLQATVAPEYRGPDSGFFDAEIPAPDDADDFVRLLCFTGRDPNWTPPAG